MAQLKALRKKPECLTGAGPKPRGSSSHHGTILKPTRFLCRRNQRGEVRMSVELIVTGVALASACILLANAIEAYRGHYTRERGTEA